MENVFARVEELGAHMMEYVNVRMEAVKLSTAEKTSKAIAGALAFAVALQFLMLFLIFASFALAYAFAEWTEKLYWGFLIVAGIYLVAGIIMWMAREKLLRLPLMNAMLRQMHTGNKEEEENEED